MNTPDFSELATWSELREEPRSPLTTRIASQTGFRSSADLAESLLGLGSVVRLHGRPCPLHVVLRRQNGDKTWGGFFISDYSRFASAQDFILAEPLTSTYSRMVLRSLPIRIRYDSCYMTFVGALSSSDIEAIEALESCPIPMGDAVPGIILPRELADGTTVVTGTPMSSNDDPRKELHQAYRALVARTHYLSLSGAASTEKALAAGKRLAAFGSSTAAELTLAANRAASVFLSWADTVASAFRLESVGSAPMHAAGGLPDRFLFERGEYVDVDVDYDAKIVKVSSCFDPEGRRYKLFFLTSDNEVVAHVPREKDGYLSIDRFDGDFEERCPEIFDGLKMEIREVPDAASGNY